MPIASMKNIEAALEQIMSMPLPENEDVFSLEIHERNGVWEVDGVVDPFAHATPEGHPYSSSMCVLPTFDLEFPSREDALEYAQKLHDVLVGRGKQPEGPTTYLLEGN